MAIRGGLHGPGEGRKDLCIPAEEEALWPVEQAAVCGQGRQAAGKASLAPTIVRLACLASSLAGWEQRSCGARAGRASAGGGLKGSGLCIA